MVGEDVGYRTRTGYWTLNLRRLYYDRAGEGYGAIGRRWVSSRGFFIGQVIDDLDAIASQVKARCKLGQADLNRVLEDFFKELLNLTYGINLRNLNDERSNEPSLDLGDASAGARVAYQVTSQATAKKVNDTLKKITTGQTAQYDRFFVLVIGERQGSYTLDPALCAKYKFAESNIVDMTQLARDIMALELSDLQAVHRKLADEQRRIRIELEPELPDGTFATSVLQFIEARPTVKRSDASLFYDHPDVSGLFKDRAEAQKGLDAFVDELARLPRLTREFYGWLIDEADQKSGFGGAGLEINADYVDAKCRNMPNFMSEIRLLTARNFIDYDKEEGTNDSGVFRIFFPDAHRTSFGEAFIYFRESEKITASTLFSNMNFAPFGPTPAPAKPMKIAKKGGKVAAKKGPGVITR